MVRNKRNKIESLKYATGEWVTEPARLEKMVSDFYMNLFREENTNQTSVHTRQGNTTISEKHREFLNRPVTHEEIKKTVFEMSPFKAPGTDGIHAGFYQKTWETVGNSICTFVKIFF